MLVPLYAFLAGDPAIDLHAPVTLGLDLVVTLARQLGAGLQVRRAPGTTFVLTFPTVRSHHEHRE